jgi:hypothetical protein
MNTTISCFKSNLPNCFVSAQTTTRIVGAGEWICLSGRVALQVTGDAQSCQVQVERSTNDPLVRANNAPVDLPIKGNPSEGILVEGYYEPAVAWWRVVIQEVSGGEIIVDLSGGMGGQLLGGQ